MVTREEHDTRQRFRDRYGEDRTDVVRQIEQAVIGADWGANGYTTVAQADVLRAALGLGPGVRLLDLGAGRGWPGLYLAVRVPGCAQRRSARRSPPRAGARRDRRRHRPGHSGGVERSRVPFRPATFDAVVHTDVLC